MITREERLARAELPAEEALRLHPRYRGKIQTALKCPVAGPEDFAVWYTPGVAAPCKAIRENPDLVFEHTNRGNTIAIVTDGTRVLGLGDIGPEAGLPVMEGKALLFKYLGGVDAVPLCLATKDPWEIIRTVELVAPSFAAVNLEDIEQPKCFRVLEALRERSPIPVWHDDQQGTATVLVAAVISALRVVSKRLDGVKIAMIGAGAANVAGYRLLRALGAAAAQIVVCDSRGVLHPRRADLDAEREHFPEKWRIAVETDPRETDGGAAAALRGADVCVAFSRSGPGVIRREWIRSMRPHAIVLACANPIPEIWPWEAEEAGAAIVATGRSDFPNQVNNSLGFPGIFRGVLDVRARTITDEMAIAAANALAEHAAELGVHERAILPAMWDPEAAVRVAVATGMHAQRQGVARLARTDQELAASARGAILGARAAAAALMRDGCIAPK